ncbi:MAG: DUF4405 domain-containing protein [Spirochaetales bacterium]|nr:DUF4405 domain-containing protein [Spirochaetales bacterium]
MMKNKARLNYIVDIVIGIGFIVSIVSGFVLLFSPQGGYMGGRNPGFGGDLLFFGKQFWKDIHNWSSIAMAAGVLGHIILHWKWFVCMTTSLFKTKKRQDCPV